MSAVWLLVLGAAAAVVACAPYTGGGSSPQESGEQAGGAVGPGISIQQALSPDLEGPLLVNGWLWRQGDGGLRLCSALTDSSPPRCQEPSLVIAGLDLSKVEGLRRDRDMLWSAQPVQVLGELSGGVLTVAALSSG